MATTQADIWMLVRLYIQEKYNLPGCSVDIEMTTKRKPKAVWGTPEADNKYTLFVQNKQNEIIMYSEEVPGYHKYNHSPQTWAKFLATLKIIDNT